MTTFAEWMAETRDMRPYQLAGFAGCASPDSPTSPGAQFLSDVRDRVAEWATQPRTDRQYGWELSDYAHEIADGCVPIYTHQRWQTFVDLCAYHYDASDYGDLPRDMTDAAGVVLYAIGRALADALLADLPDDDDDSE